MEIIDTNENKTFHPSLDIKDGILVLGFRIKDGKDKETDLFIIKTDEGIITTSDKGFHHGGNWYTIEKKNRTLSKLAEKWGAGLFNEYIKNLDVTPYSTLKGEELYDKVKSNLKKYIELEHASDYTILTSWIIGTYFFPVFSAYPYIHVKAPKGSGKSQCLNFLKHTAFNAVKYRASLPALRDTVDALRGTYLMDQADSLARNHMEDFLDILTDAYKRGGGSVRKMVPSKVKGSWDLAEFEAYSPKGFASTNQLPEDLRDRCIVIPLIRSNKNLPTLNEEDTIWKEVRNDLYTYLINDYVLVSGNYLACEYGYKQSNEITGRKLELWIPLETILRTLEAPEVEIGEAKKRFLSRYEFAVYQASELEVVVIETVMKMMGDKTEAELRPKDITKEMSNDSFEEADSDDFTFLSDKRKATLIGRAITKFNLATKKLKRDKYGERYLFSKSNLEAIYKAYSPQEVDELDTSTITVEKPLEIKSLLDDSFSVALVTI